jgi:hypothetical protein
VAIDSVLFDHGKLDLEFKVDERACFKGLRSIHPRLLRYGFISPKIGASI